MLTLLVFLWGSVSLLLDPWEPFGIPNTIQSVGSAALLVFLLRAWNRPRRRVAEAVSKILIAYTLLLLPWLIIAWCQLGRPVDTFFLPQVAAVSMALVFPGRWWLGVTIMAAFVAESLFAFAYARHLGLDALIPITEPTATLVFAMLGCGLFVLRRRRRELARQFVRVQAEIGALERVRPQFARAQKELDEQLEIIAAEAIANDADRRGTRPGAVGRALGRLDELGGKLGSLATGDDSSSPADAERQLLAHDAQLGATVLAGLVATLGIPAIFTTRTVLGEVPTAMLAQFVSAFAIFVYLLATRRRPSSRRALWAVLGIMVGQLPAIAYNQFWLLALDRPYAPFLGHKLLMGALGLTLATRFRLGVVLIVATAASALVLWFVLDLGARRDIIALGEPVSTLVYMLIGIASLRMLEQREIVSVQLLRAEAEASAMHRRARMLLALRDRLNSPLQTLVLGGDAAAVHLPAHRAQRVQAAIDRLVELSRELAELDVLVPSPSAALDPDLELRRQI